MWTSMCPNSASMSSPSGRESFMLNAVVVPSEMTIPESPIGPSAGARSAMIITSSSPFGPLTRCLTESVVS